MGISFQLRTDSVRGQHSSEEGTGSQYLNQQPLMRIFIFDPLILTNLTGCDLSCLFKKDQLSVQKRTPQPQPVLSRVRSRPTLPNPSVKSPDSHGVGSISLSNLSRPWDRHAFDPLNSSAINFLYQLRIVSGLAAAVTSLTALRPIR